MDWNWIPSKYPHDNESGYIHQIDEEVVNHAAAYLKSDAPDLSWVYLEYTDDMAHRYGDSEQFYDAVKMMDDQMRRCGRPSIPAKKF